MSPKIIFLASLALVATCALTDVYAQSPSAAKTQPPAVKEDKVDPLTPAKKQVVDAFVDSLEVAAGWPRFVELSGPGFADDARTGIVNGAQLDRLPADKRTKVDAAVDEMIPHIVEDMKVELLKVDATALYHAIGYQVYGKHFSTRELKELTAIYSSPVYHRAMPIILEQRQRKPESSDEELRRLIGAADFDALDKLMRKPAYSKLLSRLPQTQEKTNAFIGVVVGDASETVGRKYSPILLEKIKEIMNEAPESQPASVRAEAPKAPQQTTQ